MIRACLLVCIGVASAQMDQLPKKPKASPINSDIPYIRCQVCEKMVATALKQVQEAAAETPKLQQKRRFESSSKLGDLETRVEDMLTSLCAADSSEGSWLSEYDVVKRGTALTLENQVHGDVVGGHCKRECRTLEKGELVSRTQYANIIQSTPFPICAQHVPLSLR